MLRAIGGVAPTFKLDNLYDRLRGDLHQSLAFESRSQDASRGSQILRSPAGDPSGQGFAVYLQSP